jgi:hypothetical protein
MSRRLPAVAPTIMPTRNRCERVSPSRGPRAAGWASRNCPWAGATRRAVSAVAASRVASRPHGTTPPRHLHAWRVVFMPRRSFRVCPHDVSRYRQNASPGAVWRTEGWVRQAGARWKKRSIVRVPEACYTTRLDLRGPSNPFLLPFFRPTKTLLHGQPQSHSRTGTRRRSR